MALAATATAVGACLEVGTLKDLGWLRIERVVRIKTRVEDVCSL